MLIGYDKQERDQMLEIIMALGREKILHQCGEECNELAVACNKWCRALDGDTPLTVDEALEMIREEAGDVMLLLDCLDRKGLLDQQRAKISARRKLSRWYGRVIG